MNANLTQSQKFVKDQLRHSASIDAPIEFHRNAMKWSENYLREVSKKLGGFFYVKKDKAYFSI